MNRDSVLPLSVLAAIACALLCLAAFGFGVGEGAYMAANAACVQQGFTTGTYEDGTVICSTIERKALGEK